MALTEENFSRDEIVVRTVEPEYTSRMRTTQRTSCFRSLRLAVLFALAALPPVQNTFAADPYAKVVVYANILPGNVGNSNADPASALGAPDGLSVSMGGPGASLMLDMGAETPVADGPGPDLQVLERGAAYGGADESYNVLISNSTDTNSFLFVGVGRALSLLDIHATGLASARYVWLQDLATETLNTTVPGSDIDSLRVIYYTGATNDLPPPSGASVRLTGQGAWLSWNASSATNITGYAIRRSLDGVAFSSSADITVSAQETAYHDLSLPVVSNFFYAITSIAGSEESIPVILAVSGAELALLTNQTVHLGDDTVAAWEVPSAQREFTLNFTLPGFAEGPEAELALDVFDVDNSGNAILLNGGKIGTLPTQSAGSWSPKTLRFAAGALQPGVNTLVFYGRNSSGGLTGALDDYQLRNIRLRLFGTESGINLVTQARFTHIAAGQTNVTLRWVVEQTPSLSPVDWQTVSSPIEWMGTVEETNGFFRLRDAD